jgi:hypothetical protein
MIPVATQQAPSAAHSAVSPAQIVVLDIETGHADEATVKAAIDRWSPPGNMKDEEKIEAKRAEAAQRIRERSALLDGAPVICVAVRTEKVSRVFNGLNRRSYDLKHAQVVPAGSEKAMLLAFREWLDAATTETTALVGFNLKAFDLPRLRAAYVRHRLRLPRILAPRLFDEERQPVVDVMRLFLRFYSSERNGDLMVSLDEVAERLGLPQHKHLVDGAQIPNLAAAGKIKEVLLYNSIDADATMAAYLLLAGVDREMH